MLIYWEFMGVRALTHPDFVMSGAAVLAICPKDGTCWAISKKVAAEVTPQLIQRRRWIISRDVRYVYAERVNGREFSSYSNIIQEEVIPVGVEKIEAA